MSDPDPEIAKHYGRKKDYLRTFKLFGTMIETTLKGGPVERLTEQRRMHDPICQVVSRSFYPKEPDPDDGLDLADDLPEGILVTMRQEDGHVFESPDSPDWLPARTLVWLETSGVRQDEGYWSNRYEARLVSSFIHGLWPTPLLIARHDKATRRGLAVLTPYRKQVDVIKQIDGSLTDVVKTIDSFQGHEADAVVVSLVRDSMRASWDQPLRNIGHLADPSRVNVMLSRARDLLVIIGSFDHFAGSGVPTWEKVTKAVEQYGLRRSAKKVLHA